MHVKLVPDPSLILENNPKHALHKRNSFEKNLLWKIEGCPYPKLAGAIVLLQYIIEQNMSNKDHFSTPFQLTSAENKKAVELK